MVIYWSFFTHPISARFEPSRPYHGVGVLRYQQRLDEFGFAQSRQAAPGVLRTAVQPYRQREWVAFCELRPMAPGRSLPGSSHLIKLVSSGVPQPCAALTPSEASSICRDIATIAD